VAIELATNELVDGPHESVLKGECEPAGGLAGPVDVLARPTASPSSGAIATKLIFHSDGRPRSLFKAETCLLRSFLQVIIAVLVSISATSFNE
jgi:hypothetical protein